VIELIWDDQFKKIYRKWIRRHPELQAQFGKKITVLPGIPFTLR